MTRSPLGEGELLYSPEFPKHAFSMLMRETYASTTLCIWTPGELEVFAGGSVLTSYLKRISCGGCLVAIDYFLQQGWLKVVEDGQPG